MMPDEAEVRLAVGVCSPADDAYQRELAVALLEHRENKSVPEDRISTLFLLNYLQCKTGLSPLNSQPRTPV
jgi:hypothetical protein